MSNDDQRDEVEALGSIFGDDFETLDGASHRIFLAPYPGTDQSSNHVSLRLVTVMPEAYPSVPPILSIEIVKGISTQQLGAVLDIANASALESLGMPSIYMVCEAVREWLLNNNVPGQDGSMYAEMMRRTQQKEIEGRRKEEKASIGKLADSERGELEVTPEELERIRRRQAGTPVTVESFMEWRRKFEEEMRSKVSSKAADTDDSDRPTGKQLFLSNSAGKEEEEEGGGEDSEEDDEDYVDEGDDGEEEDSEEEDG